MENESVPERIGDYVIERCLGEGGMAKVYLARHAVLDSHHAIKVLDPSYRANPAARQRFLDEAKIQAGQLDHPNIVKVVNIVATSEHAALVMELIDGPSLESRIGHLQDDPAQIRTIMLAVLDAVGYAHDKGIIHRDLKPANVLLAMRGSQLIPKVTDFGIAKITGGGTGKKSTHAEARMGTLTYSSPEQLRSAKDVTPRSDVFSLGAILYELASGQPAFAGDNDYDVMDAIIKGRYTPPEQHHANIDPVIAAVIRKALEPDPAKRFATCKEMADALTARGAAPAKPPPAAAPQPVDEIPLQPAPRRTAAWLGLGAVVVGGGVIAMIATRDGGKNATQVAVQPRDAGVCAGDAAICTSPPGATCATPTMLRSYAAAGTCSAAKGGCSYEPVDRICGGGCANGACNPQVDVGIGFSCAISSSGELTCWGKRTPPQPEGAFSFITVGHAHVCGVSGGALVCWGVHEGTEQQPTDLIPTSASAGDGFTCALRTTGVPVCWLRGESPDRLDVVKDTPTNGTFTSLSAGSSHACGVRTDGSVRCWGRNIANQASPPSGTFKSVSAGFFSTCGVTTEGDVVCWGSKGMESPPADKFASLSVGTVNVCGVTINGSVRCWGADIHGASSPPSGTFASVSVGNAQACGVRTDGSIACWGDNEESQSSPPLGSAVSLGEPDAQGDLDNAIIRRYLKRHLAKITRCYEKEVRLKPTLEGTVSTQFFITPNGNVATATASGVDPEVANCIADVIKDVEFPKPNGGGGVHVNYPFTFRPYSAAPSP